MELQAVTWKCNGLHVIHYITFVTLHACLLSENSHPYSSLSEDHNGILYLANLPSLASRAEQRQEALCSDNYQQALIKIIPKEYIDLML